MFLRFRPFLISSLIFLPYLRFDYFLKDFPKIPKQSIALCEKPQNFVNHADVFDRVRPSVMRMYNYDGVNLTTIDYIGSAFIIESNGLALTAAHLFDGSRSSKPIVAELSDGSWIRYKIVAHCDTEDIAIIQPVTETTRRLPFIPLPSPKDCPPVLRQGEGVLTYGCVQYCDEPVAVTGTVAQPKQTFSMIDTIPRAIGFVQLAIITMPGMSGSPFFRSEDGALSGIIVKKYEEYGLAVPLWRLSTVVEHLKKDGKFNAPLLGVRLLATPPPPSKWGGRGNAEVLEWERVRGVTVGEVTAGGAAAAAGLKRGDIIVRVGSMTVTCQTDVVEAFSRGSFKKMEVFYLRNGIEERTLMEPKPQL